MKGRESFRGEEGVKGKVLREAKGRGEGKGKREEEGEHKSKKKIKRKATKMRLGDE